MNIKPSAAIRNNYNEISVFCKTTGQPVYLTKNGEGDLVVMNIEAFVKREKMLKLREELIAAEEERALEIEEFEKYTQTKMYIEEVARDKLGLVYEGEILFKDENN